MMPHAVTCRQKSHAARTDQAETDTDPGPTRSAFTLVYDAAHQEVDATSRRLRRASDFRAAARFMVGAGFYPRAGQTTLLLADTLASRMHRSSKGHVPFSVEATAQALGLARRTVMYHARYLRELGLLAYVEHGSRANAVRARLGAAWTRGDGYRATATLLAPCAPRVWDHAHGRRVDGSGYTARVIGVTPHGRDFAIHQARQATSARPQCTPSVVVPPSRERCR